MVHVTWRIVFAFSCALKSSTHLREYKNIFPFNEKIKKKIVPTNRCRKKPNASLYRVWTGPRLLQRQFVFTCSWPWRTCRCKHSGDPRGCGDCIIFTAGFETSLNYRRRERNPGFLHCWGRSNSRRLGLGYSSRPRKQNGCVRKVGYGVGQFQLV